MTLQLKKIAALSIVTLVVLGLTSCSPKRTKTDGAGGEDGGIKTETTADGGSEKIDASPVNFAVQGSDSETIAGLKTVFFDYDTATLTSAEKAKLEGNVAWMKQNSSSKLTVEGHCDQRGSNEYNLALGERRANAVKQAMIQMGISSNRITTVSFGEEKPLSNGDSEGAWAKNRRANFVPATTLQ